MAKPLCQRFLTVERLREVLHYDTVTGFFTWKVRLAHKSFIGDRAGRLNKDYRIICIDRINYRANRLAWFYVTGEWPSFEVDHQDHNRDNNAWTNLQDITKLENLSRRRFNG